MTTSKSYSQCYVWIWLPKTTEPVVAGVLEKDGETLNFTYGKSYLARENKISLFELELPLRFGVINPLTGLNIPGCIRDGAPDAWGRRVLINRFFGKNGKDIDVTQLDELTYLLESGSDRIGALDFQVSATDYVPRLSQNASLDELMESASMIEKGISLTPALAVALHHGTAIGGARPKALIDSQGKKFIAKFSSSTDIFNVVKAEFIAMRLAKLAGLNVADVELKNVSGKDVLLIERFDRVKSSAGWQRKCMVSALTILKLDEMMARYSSYEDIAENIRHSFYEASLTLKELFTRLIFNILVGNTDDHARNHAAFWDGRMLTLTPAYDICPQPRTGNEATQAMQIHGQNRMAQIANCFEASASFMLTREQALKIVETLIHSLTMNWKKVCSEAQIGEVDKYLLQSRAFLNPFAFENLPEGDSLAKAAEKFRKE